jgi:hypothetical protein
MEKFCLHIVLAGHSLTYAAHFVFWRDAWIRTQRAAVASRCATNLATHLLFVREMKTNSYVLTLGMSDVVTVILTLLLSQNCGFNKDEALPNPDEGVEELGVNGLDVLHGELLVQHPVGQDHLCHNSGVPDPHDKTVPDQDNALKMFLFENSNFFFFFFR